MPKLKVPSGPEEIQSPPVKKKHVRLKNAFPPDAKKRRLVARAKLMARKRLSCVPKATQSFSEAFGSSDDEVSLLYCTVFIVRVRYTALGCVNPAFSSCTESAICRI